MLNAWGRWWRRWRPRRAPIDIPAPLWQQTLSRYSFLAALDATAQNRLRTLSARFLSRKEFHGAHGFIVTDEMALAIATQACLPLLHLSPGHDPLIWYDDFVGIVVHADEVTAQREVIDSSGVVHQYREVLAGEAYEAGPVMLSWHDVATADVEIGYNVVIHEFMHKLDQRDGATDGCPPLPSDFMGQPSARQARSHWKDTLQATFEAFREQVIRAERFGQPAPWLDPYGAESISEFFAVAGEAYFVNRPRFAADFPMLLPLFDAFFQSGRSSAATD